MSITIYREPATCTQTGRPRSSLRKDISEGLFTKPVNLGPLAVGWPSNEIEAINAARIAGKSPDEIRELVRKLEAGRKLIAGVTL